MTTEELIDKLKEFPPETEVLIEHQEFDEGNAAVHVEGISYPVKTDLTYKACVFSTHVRGESKFDNLDSDEFVLLW